ncbi:MAG TPA: fasciclin domain-containing protein [Candidatus Dormibacteraeota bacterium]|nr:fasciclin domain-containing protein [Candidatus Dormibacteraeota bacterium]
MVASPVASPASMPAATQNIVQIASGNADFSTLVTAVKAAGLVDTLSGAGPFTVFAPTNEAFSALPAGTLDSLLKPENKATLTSILTYHVVPGSVFAKDVTAGSVMTVNGAKFTISIDNGSVFIMDGKGNKAKIVKTDIAATNGVIHVIDAVLLPAS